MITYKTFIFEAIGTFVVMFYGMMAVERDDQNNIRDHTRSAIARGLSLAVFVYLSSKMGMRGYFNPMVTFCMMLLGRMSGSNFILHVIVQAVSSIFAGLAIKLLRPPPVDEFIQGNYPSINVKISLLTAFFIEVVSTFLFVLAILTARMRKRSDPFYTAVVSCGVVATIKFAFGEATGGMVNPISLFGPPLVDGNLFQRGWWVFWAGSLVGAIPAVYFTHIYLESRSPNRFLKNMEAGFTKDPRENESPVMITYGLPSLENSIDLNTPKAR